MAGAGAVNAGDTATGEGCPSAGSDSLARNVGVSTYLSVYGEIVNMRVNDGELSGDSR
jgi:hypothetical protein